jgi:hypothetical protein
MYIGLGYLDNKYGIVYADIEGLVAAKRVDPHVAYLTNGYTAASRHAYVRLAKHDPGFIAANVSSKLRAVAHDAVSRFWFVLALLPLMLLFDRERKTYRRWALMIAPALVLGLGPPVAVIPYAQYEFGWLGAWGVLWLLAITWLVARVSLVLRERLGDATAHGAVRPPAHWGATLRTRPAVVLGGLTAVLLGAAFAPQSAAVTRAKDRDFYRLNASPLVDTASVGGTKVDAWAFTKGLPRGWSAQYGATVSTTPGGVLVRTAKTAFSYQLFGPELTLPPGLYSASVAGSVLQGGLYLGVLDVTTNTWSTTATYWYAQSGWAGRRMLASFTLKKPRHVRIILSNLAPAAVRSQWLLRNAEVTRAAGH